MISPMSIPLPSKYGLNCLDRNIDIILQSKFTTENQNVQIFGDKTSWDSIEAKEDFVLYSNLMAII